ncbi:hypothetical protein GOP47_0023539 [Adiantum capillus-veneris]|uniref:Uncharacterized protein n=1 Tax=Adiantum capillus-veneris TaxID=13818 RepID=A0A9D4U5V3_ADICA|nr:hypothetical protein GOP47_0023539 [Adiantum capillus-veneris]
MMMTTCRVSNFGLGVAAARPYCRATTTERGGDGVEQPFLAEAVSGFAGQKLILMKMTSVHRRCSSLWLAVDAV